MGGAASVEKPTEPTYCFKEEELSEEEKALLEGVLKQTREATWQLELQSMCAQEVLEQINEERDYANKGFELKAAMEKRKYSNEKKVLFLSDGIASWPVAVNAAKEETPRLLGA